MILPTYSLVKVKDIRNGVVILNDDNLRCILSISGINFSLLSEQEQNIVISQFKNFLDGLDFPVEILIVSRLENIADYLKILHLRLEEEKEPLIKFQLEEYISFLEDYLKNHIIMKKLFFVIVPYDSVSLKISGFSGLKSSKEVKEEDFNSKLEQLETRINYVIDSLSNIGLMVKKLNDREILSLLFESYNPDLRWDQVPKQIIEKLNEIK